MESIPLFKSYIIFRNKSRWRREFSAIFSNSLLEFYVKSRGRVFKNSPRNSALFRELAWSQLNIKAVNISIRNNRTGQIGNKCRPERACTVPVVIHIGTPRLSLNQEPDRCSRSPGCGMPSASESGRFWRRLVYCRRAA